MNANAPTLSRAQIIAVTARVLREVGYDGTTIRRLAAELNCAVGSIYRYFIDKRELLMAVTQQTLEPVARSAEAGEPLPAVAQRYHALARADRGAYQLMFWLAALEQTPGEHLPVVVARIVLAWEKQLGHPQTAYEIWSLLHGAIARDTGWEQLSPALRQRMTARPTIPAPTGSALASLLIQPVSLRVPVDAGAGASTTNSLAETASGSDAYLM